MIPSEKQCLNCGTDVSDGKPKFDAKAKFRGLIKYFMYGCGALAVLSLFMNVGPSFMTCVIMTLILGLVLSSASEMMIDKEGK